MRSDCFRRQAKLDSMVINEEVLKFLNGFLGDLYALDFDKPVTSRLLGVRSPDDFDCFERNLGLFK